MKKIIKRKFKVVTCKKQQLKKKYNLTSEGNKRHWE